MNKIKDTIVITMAALAFLLITGIAKADENSKTTPKEFVEAVASVPAKLGNHIKDEWADIKEYQANSWADMKFKFKGFKDKFINTGESQ